MDSLPPGVYRHNRIRSADGALVLAAKLIADAREGLMGHGSAQAYSGGAHKGETKAQAEVRRERARLKRRKVCARWFAERGGLFDAICGAAGIEREVIIREIAGEYREREGSRARPPRN